MSTAHPVYHLLEDGKRIVCMLQIGKVAITSSPPYPFMTVDPQADLLLRAPLHV